MERLTVNPWAWQNQRSFVQANDISGVERGWCAPARPVPTKVAGRTHPGDMEGQIR